MQYFRKTKNQRPLSKQAHCGPKRVAYQLGGTEFLVDEHYTLSKLIGVGAYGFVAAGASRATKKKVAVKKVQKAFSDLVDAKRILREIKLLKFFKHPNIVSITDILRPEAKVGYQDVYIVTELMETDLHKVIYSRQQLSGEHHSNFAYQLLKGLLCLHSAQIIHRDLKPSNILLNSDCQLKICDLGLARGYEEEDETKTEYVITRWYRAPEVILNATQYTKAVDMWSVGCILAELIGRTPLFPGEDYLDQVQRIIAVLGTPSSSDIAYIGSQEALRYIKKLPKRTRQPLDRLFPSADPLLLDLISKMLTFDPERRITVEEALAHPYFEDIRDQSQEIRSRTVFDWSWDDFELSTQRLQIMIYEESLDYQPKEQPLREVHQLQTAKLLSQRPLAREKSKLKK